jgi:hypothetical protein
LHAPDRKGSEQQNEGDVGDDLKRQAGNQHVEPRLPLPVTGGRDAGARGLDQERQDIGGDEDAGDEKGADAQQSLGGGGEDGEDEAA